uniref:Uncharacterized protein n=1 Tax=Strongyloides papillosus TaxID=174720 RepID=A0A0N5BRG3_STREA
MARHILKGRVNGNDIVHPSFYQNMPQSSRILIQPYRYTSSIGRRLESIIQNLEESTNELVKSENGRNIVCYYNSSNNEYPNWLIKEYGGRYTLGFASFHGLLVEIDFLHKEGKEYTIYIGNEDLYNKLENIKNDENGFRKAFNQSPAKKRCCDLICRIVRSLRIYFNHTHPEDKISNMIEYFTNAVPSPKLNYIYYYECGQRIEV